MSLIIVFDIAYIRGRQPMASVPSEMIFNGTQSEMKYNNYLIKIIEFLIQ